MESGGFPFIAPCVPSQRTQPPEGEAWLHEIKFDGWRGQLHKRGNLVLLYSKRGKDLSFRFPDIVAAAEQMATDDLILDGEITALDRQGHPNFQALHRADADYLPAFWAFDLLRIGERDLRMAPLDERKAELADLLSVLSGTICPHVRQSESFRDGHALLEAAVRFGLEGIVSKKRVSAYRSGRCRTWLKVKTAFWRDANRERWKMFERRPAK